MYTNETFTTKLREQLTEIRGELETIATHNNETDDWEVRTNDIEEEDEDINLQADVAEDADERIAMLVELETRYRTINQALAKIAAGTYGSCELCGADIAIERLEANPAARTCREHRNDETSLPLA